LIENSKERIILRLRSFSLRLNSSQQFKIYF